jgi:hypothetical protein
MKSNEDNKLQVSFLETTKYNIDGHSGGIYFTWISFPPRGSSGGILLGVGRNTMKVLANSHGEFHIKLHMRNRVGNFIWSFVTVYGAAQEDSKTAFLRELVNLTKDNPYLILIGGQFASVPIREK